MERKLARSLFAWRESRDRYPLLIRGARQVGKTYLIQSFGEQAYKKVVTVNFDLQPELKQCFQSLNPVDIINTLQIMLNTNIDEDSLLFLDEIQECPPAIMSLRYFREKMSRQPVIGAGSLLEFALRDQSLRMPVGRVKFLYLYPIDFEEFLNALGHQQLLNSLKNVNLTKPLKDPIHTKLMSLIRQYFILGGMPAVVQSFIKQQDINECQTLQAGLLQAYRHDFGQYATKGQINYLSQVFQSTPRLIGKRVRYKEIDENSKSRDLKNAIQLLSLANVLHLIKTTSASGLPLGARINEKKFKLNFLDIGLLQYASGLQAETITANNLTQINSGALSEQFVGQELLARGKDYDRDNLFFWARDKKGSQAEVDFVINLGGTIVPIEVKSGKTGRLKSLHIFLREKKSPIGIQLCAQPLSLKDNILVLPFYLIGQLGRLWQELPNLAEGRKATPFTPG